TAGRVAATRTPGRAITPARRRGPTADKAAAKGKVATATHSVLLARPLSSGRCRGRRKLCGETGLFARQVCYVVVVVRRSTGGANHASLHLCHLRNSVFRKRRTARSLYDLRR